MVPSLFHWEIPRESPSLPPGGPPLPSKVPGGPSGVPRESPSPPPTGSLGGPPKGIGPVRGQKIHLNDFKQIENRPKPGKKSNLSKTLLKIGHSGRCSRAPGARTSSIARLIYFLFISFEKIKNKSAEQLSRGPYHYY